MLFITSSKEKIVLSGTISGIELVVFTKIQKKRMCAKIADSNNN
jgi:hypothetical protein